MPVTLAKTGRRANTGIVPVAVDRRVATAPANPEAEAQVVEEAGLIARRAPADRARAGVSAKSAKADRRRAANRRRPFRKFR